MRIVKIITLLILSLFFISLFFINVSTAEEKIVDESLEEYVFLYTLLDSLASNLSVLSTKITVLDSYNDSFTAYPLKIDKLSNSSRALAFTAFPADDFNEDLIQDNEILSLIFFNSKQINKSFTFVRLKVFQGKISEFKSKLRSSIEENRNKLSESLEELKKMNSYIDRLRKDAKLIAGYNKIEIIKKEKNKIKRKIAKKKLKLNFLNRIISSARDASSPRSFERRQQELVKIINKLAKDTGTDINFDKIYDQAYQEESVGNEYEEGITANDQDLLNQYEYLVQERRKLENYFGYEEDEFSVSVSF